MPQPELLQKDCFLQTEGDAWFNRNSSALSQKLKAPEEDLLMKRLLPLNLSPKSILEIGAANGFRLEIARKRWGSNCVGIEPSPTAIKNGRENFPKVTFMQGTADSIDCADASFDLVMIGFCLYLCDRKDLFRIAAEVDRVLQSKGYLAILDFYSPDPKKNAYKHQNGIFSYKMDCSALFSWNPDYTIISHTVMNHDGVFPYQGDFNDSIAVTILRKDSEIAYPSVNP